MPKKRQPQPKNRLSPIAESVSHILSGAVSQEEAALVDEKPHKLPSIITIALISHGRDLPGEPFFDENVRILSYAGRSGSLAFGSPQTLAGIIDKFEQPYLDYKRSLPKKGIKKYMEQLYTEFPNANRCQKMPDFSFEDGRATPTSSYNFLKDNFTKEKENPRQTFTGTDDSLLDYRQIAMSLVNTSKREGISNGKMDDFTYEDAESKLTHRIYTPVINKLYSFIDPEDTDLPRRQNFGIYVLDICNYDQKSSGHVNIAVEDNLLKSKKTFNSSFLEHIEEHGDKTDLEYFCGYMHRIGFDIINLIDIACRGYSQEDFPERRPTQNANLLVEGEQEEQEEREPIPVLSPRESARARTSVHEFLRNSFINKARGIKSHTRKNKHKHKSKLMFRAKNTKKVRSKRNRKLSK
jgi:hypothetical protein